MNTFIHQRRLQSKKQKGFTLAEIAIVLVIIGLLVAVALPEIFAARDNAKVDAALTQTQTVLKGATKYGPRNGNKTGISMAVLHARGLVPEEYTDFGAAGVDINPWGGDVQVTVNGTDPRQIDITFTEIDDDAGGLFFSEELEANGAVSATYAAGTATAVFKAG